MPEVDLLICDIMAIPMDRAAGCDITFTDPPWEQGLVRMFETIQKKQTGIEPPGNDINEILKRLAALAPSDKPAFVEYGLKGYERVIVHMEDVGHRLHRVQPALQVNGKPYVILCFNTDIPDFEREPKNWDMLNRVNEYHKPKWVFEPFAGQGMHVGKWHKHGVNVRASELNPYRASKIVKEYGLA